MITTLEIKALALPQLEKAVREAGQFGYTKTARQLGVSVQLVWSVVNGRKEMSGKLADRVLAVFPIGKAGAK